MTNCLNKKLQHIKDKKKNNIKMCDDVCKCVILGYRNKIDLTFTGIRRKGQHLGQM